jgi:small-conductance mechanosensitive channel
VILARRTLLAATLAGWLVPIVASAQTVSGAASSPGQGAGAQALAAATAPAATPEPAAIPVAEISRRAQQTRDRLREIEASLPPDETLSAIEKRLGGALEGLQRDARDCELRMTGRLSAREIFDLEQRWLRSKDLLDGWQDTLVKRLRALERELEGLRRLQDLWSGTLAKAPSEAVPAATVSLIRDTLESVRATDSRVRARRGELLILQDRIFEGLNRVAQVLDRIRQAKDAARRDLLSIDSPPLWKAFGPTGLPGASVAREVADSWARAKADATEFGDEFAEHRHLHFGIFLCILALLPVIRRRLRAREPVRDDLAPAVRLLGRPLSAALLVGLLLTPLLYPRAPLAIQNLIGILTLIPVLRLLPLVLPPRTLAPLLALALLVLLALFAGLLPEVSAVYRIALLVTDLASGLGLLWMLRTRVVTAAIERPSWREFTRLMARVALALLAAAVLSNLVGNVTLAIALTRGVLTSAYAAVLLFAANRVLDGLVRVTLASAPLQLLRAVRDYTALLQRRVASTLRLAAFAAWALLTLDRFEFLPAVVDLLKAAWSAHATFGEVSVSLGNILTFLLVLGGAVLVARLVQFVLEEEVVARLDLPRGLPTALTSTARYSILFLGFLFALAAAGVEFSKFTILAGAFGVGVGFGLQAVVNNFVSGLILLFEQPVRPGDWVQIGPTLGEVTRIGGRSSTVRTYEGAEVIVPNSHLISNEVINWTLSDPRVRVEIKLGVAYGSDPAGVLDLLRAAAATHPRVLAAPAPAALFTGFGDSSLDFVLRVWTDSFAIQQQVRSDIAIAVHRALNDAGITIPFPQRDLHLRSVDPAAGRALGRPPD